MIYQIISKPNVTSSYTIQLKDRDSNLFYEIDIFLASISENDDKLQETFIMQFFFNTLEIFFSFHLFSGIITPSFSVEWKTSF